ncbi:hypothetical protein [Cellulomonas sp. PhB143]|uniref:hypothetical protein n=1 Tax=Cellulomonas sp. PhB143 TaxID=2485186 RepID=UPI000F46617C|nr:hypothetical protein [Cellulomonas sp. PhB143]ROS74479.1 hypothetical protein EDF32_2225 [Cellulomonas sp. PhB143]
MWWWILWVVLVVGAVCVVAWLVRDVWRRARRFLRELSKAEGVLSDLSARAAELERLAAADGPVGPVDMSDVPAARARVDERRLETVARRGERRARRHARDAELWGRWERDEL